MTIERMKISRADAEPDPRTELAKQANSLLGYERLAIAAIKNNTLTNALIKLDIAPLNRVSVEQYKAKKAKPGMWSDVALGLCLAPVALGLLLACARLTYLCNSPGLINPGSAGWNALYTLGAFVTAALAVLSVILMCTYLFDGGHSGAHRVRREWRTEFLNGYAGAVPDFVLSKAVQIKQECPQVCFLVEQLYETEELIERRAVDPFLVARLDKESFYIDVWDEKEYEAKL
jgi:hypothetical protein